MKHFSPLLLLPLVALTALSTFAASSTSGPSPASPATTPPTLAPATCCAHGAFHLRRVLHLGPLASFPRDHASNPRPGHLLRSRRFPPSPRPPPRAARQLPPRPRLQPSPRPLVALTALSTFAASSTSGRSPASPATTPPTLAPATCCAHGAFHLRRVLHL